MTGQERANSAFYRWVLLVLLAVAVVAPGQAQAAIVGDTAVPYSATRIVIVNGKEYRGKVFAIPGKQRHDVDINGLELSFVLDIAGGAGVIAVPALHSYVDFPLPPLLAELDRQRLEGHAAGEERIAGFPAVKYRLEYTASDGSRGTGFLWLTRDNILLRIDGRIERPGHRPMTVAMRLEDLRLGPQDDKLFQISNGLKKLPYQALEMLLNLRLRARRH
jgi:hypothetical protein